MELRLWTCCVLMNTWTIWSTTNLSKVWYYHAHVTKIIIKFRKENQFLIRIFFFSTNYIYFGPVFSFFCVQRKLVYYCKTSFLSSKKNNGKNKSGNSLMLLQLSTRFIIQYISNLAVHLLLTDISVLRWPILQEQMLWWN